MSTQAEMFDEPRDPAMERADLIREHDALMAEWSGRDDTSPTAERKQSIDLRIRAIRERLTKLREERTRREAAAGRPLSDRPSYVDRRSAAAGRERD